MLPRFRFPGFSIPFLNHGVGVHCSDAPPCLQRCTFHCILPPIHQRGFLNKKKRTFQARFHLGVILYGSGRKEEVLKSLALFFWHRQPGGVLNPLFCHRHSTANLQLLFLQQSWRNYNKRSLLCLNFSRKRMNDRPVIFSLSLHGFWTNSSVKKYRSMLF